TPANIAEGVFQYIATSVDGNPIRLTPESLNTVVGSTRVLVENAEKIGLSLTVDPTCIAPSAVVQLTKTGDRASAVIGDIVIYRLVFRNLSTSILNQIKFTDVLPFGFQLIPNSVRAEIVANGGTTPLPADQIQVSSSRSTTEISITPSLTGSSTPVFSSLGVSVAQSPVINVVYGALLTPDALRGDGRNVAIVNGNNLSSPGSIAAGPVYYQVRVQPGILADGGTLIGRVFVDKNFDGEQQPGEAGIPNAVLFMDDGNRIVTDANGLFSVANVQPGYRTATLDLSSLPGYAIAPNLYFSERNSQSRLVHLAPGGLVRMNFGVTPAFQEIQGGQK
ncbi:MAG: hypothetical protein VKJ46_13845, partial [Leptolyngbyaceae bacterium]|nr:hypothetical protein [Leptolyngbyaceae bacterium]